MPQDIFEVIALEAAALQAVDIQKSNDFLAAVFTEYASSYGGDSIWTIQALEILDAIIDLSKNYEDKFFIVLLKFTGSIRKELDENLQLKSKIKGLFGGTLFTKSHPAPHLRSQIALVNINNLLRITSSDTSYLVNLNELKKIRSLAKIREWAMTDKGISHKRNPINIPHSGYKDSNSTTSGYRITHFEAAKDSNFHPPAFIEENEIDWGWTDRWSSYLGCPKCGKESCGRSGSRTFRCESCEYSFVSPVVITDKS